jgi:ABC-type Na+ transport system ATPase subunit NatA
MYGVHTNKDALKYVNSLTEKSKRLIKRKLEILKELYLLEEMTRRSCNFRIMTFSGCVWVEVLRYSTKSTRRKRLLEC